MMNQQKMTLKQKSVLSALNNQHLTSVEILNEAKSIPHILTLYSILDELRNMGMIQSYMKQNLRYHVAIA